MCLTVFNRRGQKTQLVGKTRFRKNKDGLVIGYKVVDSDDRSPFKMVSHGYMWKEGVNTSSRSRVKRTTAEDLYINTGFHVCATIGFAEEILHQRSSSVKYDWLPRSYKIIRVLIDPKWVVAEGYFWEELCLVCTKCVVPSLKGLKYG